MSRDKQPPPPGAGGYVRAEILELVSDEERAGRPVPPAVELAPAGPTSAVAELVDDGTRDPDWATVVAPAILRAAEPIAAALGFAPEELAREVERVLLDRDGPDDEGPCLSEEFFRDLPRVVQRIGIRLGADRRRHQAKSPSELRGTPQMAPDKSDAATVRSRVTAALKLLPRKQRVVVERIVDAFATGQPVTGADIAQELGIPAAAVRDRLAKALLHLRDALRSDPSLSLYFEGDGRQASE